MSKSAWTCSRGNPPPFFASPPAVFPPLPDGMDRKVIPTHDARRDVASSAHTCRTSDERRSLRSETNAPDLDNNLCPSSPSPVDLSPSSAQRTARLDSGLAPCRRNAARRVASMRSAAAASTAAGAPRSVAAARSATSRGRRGNPRTSTAQPRGRVPRRPRPPREERPRAPRLRPLVVRNRSRAPPRRRVDRPDRG